jgi:hypothetical protein
MINGLATEMPKIISKTPAVNSKRVLTLSGITTLRAMTNNPTINNTIM